MRCVIYARISRDRWGLSENIAIQLEECRAYSEERGWTIVGVFEDNDISASKFSTKPRPGYESLLAAVRASEADVVLVTEVTRLYRKLEELLALIQLAETTSLSKIESTNGNGYDLSTGEGIHNAVTAVNNAMLESRLISDRIKRKKKARARTGAFNGGKRPYGYEPDGVTIRESEAAIIRDVARRLLVGESLRSVAGSLNERGVLTVTGKKWEYSNLRNMLQSPRLKGVRQHNGAEYPAVWPAILDAETWELLQVIFRGSATVARQYREPRSYLLTGLIQCGVCGKMTVAGYSKSDRYGNPNRSYYCVIRDTGNIRSGCGGVRRLADPVDLLVSEAVLDVLDSPQMGEMLAHASETTEMRELIETYEAKKLKLRDLVDDYASGLLNREQLAQAKEIVEEAMEDTRRKMEKIKSGMVFASLAPGESIRDAWAKHDLYWRRSLIAMLIEKIILHKSKSRAAIWQPKGSDRSWRFDPSKVEIVWRGARDEQSDQQTD
jgi:site-specific DNA recombinase